MHVSSRNLCVLMVLGGFALAPGWAGEAEDQLAQDEKQLKEAGLPADAAGLLDFFRKRTPSEADRAALRRAVPRLGAEAFAIREQASQDLVAAGRPALTLLRP